MGLFRPPVGPRAGGAELVPYGEAALQPRLPLLAVDVVFPVMHGTLCEDGAIQGLLELAELPYVGCGVLASAVGMDKEVAKRLAQAAALPIVPYVLARSGTWEAEFPALAVRVEQSLGYPCFVKPVSCGSSVGVHKVKSAAALRPALFDAFRYDRKVLIEKAIDACAHEGARAELRGIADDNERAMGVLFQSTYYPTRFKERPRLYRVTHARAPRLDLPFRAEDFDGIWFPHGVEPSRG